MSDIEHSFWQKYRDQGLQVVGINRSSVAQTSIDFVDQFGLTFPVVTDLRGRVYSEYRLLGGRTPFPLDFVIDAEGKIAYANVEYDPAEMNRVVQELLQITDVKAGARVEAPRDFKLLNGYPNPFNAQVRIMFELPRAGNVVLEIVSSLGQVVQRMTRSYVAAGVHHLAWDGADDHGLAVGSGVFYYRLRFQGMNEFGKVVLIR